MLDVLWLLLSSILIFLMQAGFLCLETGRTRSKNSINVAAKNILDALLSAAVFWCVGFGLMFGVSYHGGFGTSNFFFDGSYTAYQISFFIFQLMFCGTTATIISGAVAERMTFAGYIVITLIVASVIYPITGHWIWGGAFSDGAQGWLEQLGFIDFAGSTVVHSVGGWVALAAVLIIGPRSDRFKEETSLPTGHNLPLASLGTLLIWLGWFGFNGGSTLAFNDQIPAIILNTVVAAISAGLSSVFIHHLHTKYFDVESSLNGIIAGLVAITASCHVVEPKFAVIIGIIAGFIAYYGPLLLDKLRIDDALSVIPVHAFAGVWGTLALALFADLEKLGTGLSRSEQLTIQFIGVIAVCAYSFFVSYFIMKCVNRFFPLRVSLHSELIGLNISEHRASTELINLLNEMENQQKEGSYNQRVNVEPFTEVGQIATKYNQVIDQISSEIESRDIAIKKHQLSESRKGAILFSSMDAIVSIDHKGNVIEYNPAAERLFGRYKKNVINKNFIDYFVARDHQKSVYDSVKYGFLKAGGLLINRRSNIVLTRISGETFPAEITITIPSQKYIANKEYIFHIRDVEKERSMQDRLHFLAYNDPLTKLSNRTYLISKLEQIMSTASTSEEMVAVFFLDLDNFKKINDTLGHDVGDELLCEVASRLKQVARTEDVIARWGGDEFIYLMTGPLSKDIVKNKALNILNKMREPVILKNIDYSIHTSIGISLCKQNEESSKDIIQQADIAMFKAKQSGKDNFQLYKEYMGEEAAQSLTYEQEIKIGLENKEFYLVYQPKVCSHNYSIKAAEALIRWKKSDDQIKYPNEFIPIVEDSDLIIAIGEYVIEQALRQLKDYRLAGKEIIPISVNIAERHLLTDGFVEFIHGQLQYFDIEAKYLEIEITEGVLIKDIEHCIDVLTRIKSLGVLISLDDFGTGYSSMSYLKRLPIDVLKIDRSFVTDCDNVNEDKEICQAVIHLAQGLNLISIAEGVETAEQIHTLNSLGCDMLQGYYFYKPLSDSSLEELLESA